MAIFKPRNCTLIVHQEGGAADKKCQAFAISPQFAFNSARYEGAWVLPENGWSWCRVRFQVRPLAVSLSLSVSIWVSASVSTLIFWFRIRFIRDYTLKSMRLKVKTFLQVSFVLDVDFCKRQKNGKRCVCPTKPRPFFPSSWTGSINCHQGWSSKYFNLLITATSIKSWSSPRTLVANCRWSKLGRRGVPHICSSKFSR